MRIAVAGGTGRIGRLTIDALDRSGHQPVPVSRSAGADIYTGAGLDAALQGADAVIDVTSTSSASEAEVVDFFGTTTRNLLAAGERAGVRHHVLLSIVGIDHGQRVAHYAGKREQERLVVQGQVLWSIVRATQFHDFAAMVAEIAAGPPLHTRLDIAGPETQDLVDMARRTFAARGKDITLLPTWRGTFGPDMAGEVLLPGDGARLTPTTFADWLAAGAR